MKKFSLAIIGIMVLVFAVRAFAATELEKVNLDLANQDAQFIYEHGNFALSNSVATNGDIIQTNSFQPDGVYSTVEIKGEALSQALIGWIQTNAVNVDTITNATIGQTGVYLAQTDKTITDLGNVAQ